MSRLFCRRSGERRMGRRTDTADLSVRREKPAPGARRPVVHPVQPLYERVDQKNRQTAAGKIALVQRSNRKRNIADSREKTAAVEPTPQIVENIRLRVDRWTSAKNHRAVCRFFWSTLSYRGWTTVDQGVSR